MTNKNILVSSALTVALAGTTAALISLRVPQPEVTGVAPVVELPFAAVRSALTKTVRHEFATGDGEVIRASVSCNSDSVSDLDFLWGYGRDGTGLLAGPLAARRVSIPVGYMITDFAFLPDGRLLMSGANRLSGAPMVEAWTLADPILEQGAPGSTPTLLAGHVTKREVLFSPPANSGIGLIDALFAGGALQEHETYFLDYESRSIFRLDATQGTAILQMSKDASVGSTPAEPYLSTYWDNIRYWGNHASHGHCYICTAQNAEISVLPAGVQYLVLCDLDRDGALDSSIPVPEGGGESLGFREASNWH